MILIPLQQLLLNVVGQTRPGVVPQPFLSPHSKETLECWVTSRHPRKGLEGWCLPPSGSDESLAVSGDCHLLQGTEQRALFKGGRKFETTFTKESHVGHGLIPEVPFLDIVGD